MEAVRTRRAALTVGVTAGLQVNGGADDDELEGGSGADVLNGGPDDDKLDDGVGSDTVNGGPGNDHIDQGTGPNGADVISGGAGSLDEVVYSSRSAGVNVSLNNVANDGAPLESDNVKDDVEAVSGSPFVDNLSGNALANFFSGGAGGDVISGGDGIDFLLGDAGNDNLTGGDGLDHLDGGPDNDTLNAIDSGPDDVDGGAGASDDCNTDAIDSVTGCEL